MGLLDTGVNSAPAIGVGNGPREDYKPPRTLRRLDIPSAKPTLREEVLIKIKDASVSWADLVSAVPRQNHQKMAEAVSVLIREGLIAFNARGEFDFIPMEKRWAETVKPVRTEQKVNHTALKDGACRECNALRCY